MSLTRCDPARTHCNLQNLLEQKRRIITVDPLALHYVLSKKSFNYPKSSKAKAILTFQFGDGFILHDRESSLLPIFFVGGTSDCFVKMRLITSRGGQQLP